MQIRKRAKSVTFGKKEKKEEVKKPVEVVSADTEKTSEKATVVERRAVPEKTLPDELSATPPKTDDDARETPVKVTPADELATDSQEESPTESTKDAKEEETDKESEKEEADAKTEEKSSTTEDEPTLSSEKPEEKPDESEEVSQAPVQSAFTIQNNGAIPDDLEGGGKRRFGVYFFVVAFLAFILGLGAMAAVTYFGNINITAIKLPAIPSFMGSNPSPTETPEATPTAEPTEKPVDLQAYTVSVLNGSGIVGKAADVKTSLTTAGFKVGTTGNADKSDYTKTQISAKKSVDQAFVTKLQDELKKTFVVEVSTADPSDSSDVTVILGQEVVK